MKKIIKCEARNTGDEANGAVAVASLKGVALIMAIDAGLVPKAKRADGWNIAPFLRFWDGFSPLLEKLSGDVLEKEG